jgi:hypothetical protein
MFRNVRSLQAGTAASKSVPPRIREEALRPLKAVGGGGGAGRKLNLIPNKHNCLSIQDVSRNGC